MWQDARAVAAFPKIHLKHLWTHFGLFLAVAFALASSGLTVLAGLSNYSGTAGRFCAPGGSFNFPGIYDPWDSEHTFQITLGFGKLSFTQAKVIDIVWDVMVGRGGQFLLAMISSHVFSKSLNHILEQPNGAISYEGFRAIVFETTSLGSTLKLVQTLSSLAQWKSRVLILWMVTASIYIVAFPTMTSAMTGYSSNVTPYFPDDGRKMPVSADYFHRAIFRIHDADRIEGLNLDQTYVVGSQGFGQPSEGAEFDYFYCLQTIYSSEGSAELSFDCSMAYAVSHYVNKSGIYAKSHFVLFNGSSYNVSSPSLGIDMFNTATDYIYGDFLSLDNNSTPSSNSTFTTTGSSQTYSVKEINSGGTCDSAPTYMWGFSFILLFGFSIATSIWAFGTYLMWNYVFWNSRLDRAGRSTGFYRGVLDISEAILKDAPKAPSKLASETQIKALIVNQPRGRRIVFDDIDYNQLPLHRKDTWRQFKQDIPSLNGWTKTWTLLHWTYFVMFTLAGLLWGLTSSSLFQHSMPMSKLIYVFGWFVMVTCWLTAMMMLLACIPPPMKFWHFFPLLGRRVKPRSWGQIICIVFFLVAGCIGFLKVSSTSFFLYWLSRHNSGSDQQVFGGSMYTVWFSFSDQTRYTVDILLLCLDVIPVAFFWFVAAIMLLTGLSSTLWRWCGQLTSVIVRSTRSCQAISSTNFGTYQRQSADGIDSD